MTEGKKNRKGRPAGLLLNPVAANHLLGADRPQAWLADVAGVTAPVLSELMAGQRGATRAVADRIAAALHCEPGVIFPELVGFKVAVRVFEASGAES